MYIRHGIGVPLHLAFIPCGWVGCEMQEWECVSDEYSYLQAFCLAVPKGDIRRRVGFRSRPAPPTNFYAITGIDCHSERESVYSLSLFFFFLSSPKGWRQQALITAWGNACWLHSNLLGWKHLRPTAHTALKEGFTKVTMGANCCQIQWFCADTSTYIMFRSSLLAKAQPTLKVS